MSAAQTLRALAAQGPIHFVGVGGAGMCALAEAVARGGGQVSGCDLNPDGSVKALEALGVQVHRGHNPSHVAGHAALVVSAALPQDHPELVAARAAGIPVVKRAQALGEWVNDGTVVAIAGTHGKTTTTAMTTGVLTAAGMNPTGFVGGEVPSWGSNLRPGRDDLFVVEADEFDRSFHHLRPSVAVVTNMEADHLDIYGTLEGVQEGFRTFLSGVREGGTVVLCADDPGSASLVASAGAGLTTPLSYGFSAGSRLRGLEVENLGGSIRVRVAEDGEDRGWMTLPLPGLHNVLNGLAAAAVGRALSAEWDAIREGLGAFEGVRRRFQRLGEVGGVQVVDDYAHHPTEVAAVLEAARGAHRRGRIVAVFQPHLFSRTRDFHQAFGEALALADEVWITEIYPARETPIAGVDGGLVARGVEAARRLPRARVERVTFHPSMESLPAVLAASLQPGDLCLTLGAGSIEKMGPALLTALRARTEEAAHA